MTTIAHHNGVIAYDEQGQRGDIICNMPVDKKVERDGFLFFFSGSTGMIDTFVECYLTGAKPERMDETCAFVVHPDGKVFVAAFNEDGDLHSDDLPRNETYAIGSGMYFAIAAMDAGLSPVEAVKLSASRDPYTGGEIHTYVVGGENDEPN